MSAAGALLVCACSLDWDALDPRLGETGGTAGVEPAAVGGSGVAGSTPSGGAAGVPGAGGTGATGGSAAAAGQAGAGTVPTGGVAGAAAAAGQAGAGTVTTGGVAGAAAAAGQAGSGTVPTGGVAGAAAAAGQAGDGGAAGAGDTPPACVVIDYVAGTGTLSEHQVKSELDTQTLIDSGAMQPDCADLRVRLEANGAELPLWIAEHSCNSPATEVWVRVPQISGGETVVLELWWGDPTAPSVADGELVFEFFDGFESTALDSARWQVHGSGSVTVAGGVLASVGDVMLQTQTNVMASGTRVLGVRIKAEGATGTDVELGAGDVSALSGGWIWAFDREWDGVTFLSYDDTLYVVDGPSGSSCDSPSIDPDGMRVGTPWADTPDTAPATFLTAEFGYETASTGTDAWLETSRDLRLEGASADACELPSQLPALIGLDHDDGSHAPTQELDYVYVRRHATLEPTASLADCSAVSP